MKTSAITLSFLLVLAAGAPLAAQTTESPDPKALIEQLGDSEFAVRKAAEEKLMKLGTKVLKQLQASAEKDPDPEVKWRAGRLVRRIKEGQEPHRGLARRNGDGRQPAPGDSTKRRGAGDGVRPFDDVFESIERSLARGGVDDGVRQEIERAMQRLRSTPFDMPRIDFGPDFGKGFMKDFEAKVSRSGQGRSMKMSSGPDGVRVEVTETDKDGNKETKVYKADDMESFNKKYPGVLNGDGIDLRVDRLFDGSPFRIDGFGAAPGGGGWRTLTPRLRNRAEADPRPPVEVEPGASEGRKLGFYYGEVAPAVRQYLGLTDGAGLSVESVAEGSLAEKLQLRQGDIVTRVGKTRVSSAADVSRGLEGIADEDVTVEVIRRGREMVLRIGHEVPAKGEKKASSGKAPQGGKLHPR